MTDRAVVGDVVVGVDGSDSARMAADWAAGLASAWNTPLRLIHVVGESAELARPAWLSELVIAVERAGAVDPAVEVVSGQVGPVLVDVARTARLVVLGSYGSGADGGLLTGTLGLTLLEWATCPVAVVRGAEPGVPPPRSGPVVVGVDGTAAGRAAAGFAAAVAAAIGARLDAVHAWTEPVVSAAGAGTQDEATAMLDAELGRIGELHPSLAVSGELADETAMQALTGRAAEARAVVVGHRRGAPHSELQPGSTARALVAFAPCPVVVLGPRCLAARTEADGPAVTAETSS